MLSTDMIRITLDNMGLTSKALNKYLMELSCSNWSPIAPKIEWRMIIHLFDVTGICVQSKKLTSQRGNYVSCDALIYNDCVPYLLSVQYVIKTGNALWRVLG
jgi:hypothetical protein